MTGRGEALACSEHRSGNWKWNQYRVAQTFRDVGTKVWVGAAWKEPRGIMESIFKGKSRAVRLQQSLPQRAVFIPGIHPVFGKYINIRGLSCKNIMGLT